MAEFTANLQNLKPSFPFVDMDGNMDFISQIGGLNPSVLYNPNVNLLDNMPVLFNDNYFRSPAKFPENWGENVPDVFCQGTQIAAALVEPTIPSGNELHGSKKRQFETDVSDTSSGNSSPQISETGTKSKNSLAKGKRSRKGNEKEEEKPRDVVHVRAKRGQATDSHSVAERIRRGKINERLRCLQDIVPGCYKTMGMAVMLDEIINYVQSLQNQVEFLSMKLTAASSFHDFNSESNAAEKMKKSEGNGGFLLASTQFGPFDLSFGPYSTLPFNTI